jgi:hypothetical protein
LASCAAATLYRNYIRHLGACAFCTPLLFSDSYKRCLHTACVSQTAYRARFVPARALRNSSTPKSLGHSSACRVLSAAPRPSSLGKMSSSSCANCRIDPVSGPAVVLECTSGASLGGGLRVEPASRTHDLVWPRAPALRAGGASRVPSAPTARPAAVPTPPSKTPARPRRRTWARRYTARRSRCRTSCASLGSYRSARG